MWVAMNRAAGERRYEDAIELAQKIIDAGFVNIEAHSIAAMACEALSKPQEAAFHKRVASALVQSILASGDGKTKQTAFEVIGTHEEHVILSIMGLPPFGTQSLITGKPHNYDTIQVDDPKTGGKVVVWFNIDAFYPMKGLR